MLERHVADERFVAALLEIETGAAENVERCREIHRRVKTLRRRLQAGCDLVELVEGEEPPRVVELISNNLTVLKNAGSEFRTAQALALRSEGLTVQAIADLYGVTRQRISVLLRR